MSTRVLIVEDEEAMAVALTDSFTYEGYTVSVARDGEEGARLAREEKPDLVILDVMLPKMSGLELLKKLRAEGDAVPVIMLTARGQEIDRVLGLKLGADDYVTKPFSVLELFARAEAVLRRSSRPPAAGAAGVTTGTVRFADVVIDFERHEATRAGEPLELSPREFQLLGFFLAHRGRVISRDELLDAVWGYDDMPYTRTVDTHIAKLRKKIEKTPSDPRLLVTVHRVGYKFVG